MPARDLASFGVALLLLLTAFVPHVESLVVPQELPSILSLVYSNIPPIKKGTDSRLGFGFRLGNHADFQILLELGPQKETRPIGENPESENNFNKRQVSKAQRQYLLRKQMQQQLQQLQQQQLSSTTENAATSSSWLETWSKNMIAQQKEVAGANKKKVKSKLSLATDKKQPEKSDDAMPSVMAAQSLQQLQLLHQMATTSATPVETTTTSAAATAAPAINAASTQASYEGGPLNLGVPVRFMPRPPEEAALQSILEPQKKSKTDITRELMDVSLEADA